MKILVVSDTHGIEKNLYKALLNEKPIDMMIHAGDTSGNEREIELMADCPSKIVLGNNDYSMSLRNDEVFEVCGRKIWLTHGHRYGVYYGTDRLLYRALELGASIVIYGHTHVPAVEFDEDTGVYIVNPGSLTFPRQEDHTPSYIVLNINEDGEVDFSIKYIDRE